MAFSHARNFRIDTFNAEYRESHSHIYHSEPSSLSLNPIQILRQARAVAATHTSRTAAYAPKCKPGSRAKVIQDVFSWINTDGVDRERGTRAPILWFQGPAGGGKTCFMREVVSRCEEMGLVTASYFFYTKVTALDSEAPLVATIAYQLCTQPRVLEDLISQAIRSYPSIFEESQERQVKTLFPSPRATSDGAPGEPSTKKIILAVDGLDECRHAHERVHLLYILRMLASSAYGFMVIIASRPEFEIRTEFASSDYRSITHIIRLQDYDGTSDIRAYLCDEFHRVRDKHPAKDTIPRDWLAEDVLNVLVETSSGCYIYPATVVKHVSNPRRNPVTLLEEVLFLSSAPKTNPLSDLDELYRHILHPADVDLPLLKRLLHCVMGVLDERDCGILKAFESIPL